MENERDKLIFDRLKSTNNMGCLLMMNERNEKNRTRPSLAVSNIKYTEALLCRFPHLNFWFSL